MHTRKLKVLFISVRNSVRSQMAEAWASHLHPDDIEASSAGLEPGTLDPVVLSVMAEEGIDLSSSHTKTVIDLFKSAQKFDRVITVCGRESSERLPFYPGVMIRLHWSL